MCCCSTLSASSGVLEAFLFKNSSANVEGMPCRRSGNGLIGRLGADSDASGASASASDGCCDGVEFARGACGLLNSSCAPSKSFPLFALFPVNGDVLGPGCEVGAVSRDGVAPLSISGVCSAAASCFACCRCNRFDGSYCKSCGDLKPEPDFDGKERSLLYRSHCDVLDVRTGFEKAGWAMRVGAARSNDRAISISRGDVRW